MGILRADRITGLGGANAITGSVNFTNDGATSTGDYLRVDRKDNSDFNLSTNDFTIEFWMYSRNVGASLHLVTFAASTVSASSDAGFYVRQFGGVVQGYCFEGNNNIGVVATGAISVERWYHIAYVRSGSTFTMYLDGTSTATATSSEAANFDASWNLNIGSAYTDVYHYNGYLSNLRIVNGTAIYTSNFTPPPNQLEKTSNTVLLACQSSGNVLQEGTNKNIHLVRSSNNNTPPEASRFIPSSPVGFSTTTDVGSQYGTTFDGFGSFATSTYMVPPGGNTRERNRGRAIFAGGARSPYLDIQALDIASGGIAQDFGDLLNTAQLPGSASSTTRMLVASGYIAPGSSNVIEFITIANIASSTDFGDLTEVRRRPQGLSNSTRGVFVGGQTPTAVNTIDYVTIATAGNAADFGDTNSAHAAHGAAVASSTRGVYTIGGVPGYTNTIEFITIATTGNGQDFGDLTVDANRGYQDRGSICDTTRGIFSGGFTGSNVLSNTIEFITMATTGNSTNFGDLPVARRGGFGTSNSRLAIFAGGYTPGSFKNAIDQVTIQSTGNATDFGDLVFAIQESSGSSDSHGGL